jgi:hypothetical protein
MTRSPIAILILCGSVSPLSAQTVCPTAADLDPGILVEYEDGVLEVFTLLPGWTTVGVLTDLPSGEQQALSLEYGLYIRSITQVENGVPDDGSTLDYQYNLEPLQAPFAGLAYDVPVSIGQRQADGTVALNAQTHDWLAGEKTQFQIGTCSYAGFTMTVSITGFDDPPRQEMYYYLADLGIGLYVGETQEGERIVAPPVAILPVSALN